MFLMSTYSASLYKATQKRYMGLAAMGYEPLYHAWQVWSVQISTVNSLVFCKIELGRLSSIRRQVLIKQVQYSTCTCSKGDDHTASLALCACIFNYYFPFKLYFIMAFAYTLFFDLDFHLLMLFFKYILY